MSAAFIIDCSITMAWCFDDETTAESARVQNRLANESALVPGLWFLEVTNVLALAERRKRITAAGAVEFMTLLGALEIEVDHEYAARAFAALWPLCRAHALTSYDAAYLDLALRRKLPLASLDDALRASASELGIEVLGK